MCMQQGAVTAPDLTPPTKLYSIDGLTVSKEVISWAWSMLGFSHCMPMYAAQLELSAKSSRQSMHAHHKCNARCTYVIQCAPTQLTHIVVPRRSNLDCSNTFTYEGRKGETS